MSSLGGSLDLIGIHGAELRSGIGFVKNPHFATDRRHHVVYAEKVVPTIHKGTLGLDQPHDRRLAGMRGHVGREASAKQAGSELGERDKCFVRLAFGVFELASNSCSSGIAM